MRRHYIILSFLLLLLVLSLGACSAVPIVGTQAQPTDTGTSAAGAPAAGPASPEPADATPAGFALASISGRVWHDLCEAGQEGQPAPTQPPAGCVPDAQGGYRANGVLDPGEPLIAGVHISLGLGACPATGQAEAVTTAADPNYAFEGLSAGTYCVTIDPLQGQNQNVLLPGGWTYPSQVDGAISQTVELKAGEQKTEVNFGWDYQFLPSTPAGAPPPPAATEQAAQPTPAAPTPQAQSTCTYKAAFLGDVTIPDNSSIAPGTSFVKTWRVRNDGTCTWGSAGFALHTLVHTGGDSLGAPDTVALPAEVRQGMVIDISVPMVAPNTPGPYRSEWMLQVDNGPQVGFGPDGNVPLYVQINVQQPGPTPGGTTRVTFAPGATGAQVSGSLAAGQSQDYILTALQSQLMMINISSSNPVNVAVSGANGGRPQLLRSIDGSLWLGQLLSTGDYVIHVTAGPQPANYSLNIVIPLRITFAPGSIASVNGGVTSARRTVTYVLRAFGGQTMSVDLSAPPGFAGITVYGLADGQPLVRAVSGAMNWSGTLPQTQDYIVEVVPATDASFNYTLRITVQ